MAAAPPYPLPTGSRLLQDLGFLACTLPQVEILMPTKKPRGRDSPWNSNGPTKPGTIAPCALRMSTGVSSAVASSKTGASCGRRASAI